MTDIEIMEKIGLLPYSENTEEIRDKYFLTEDETDEAIKEMLAEISRNGEIRLSAKTKRLASYDAICAAQFFKAYRLYNPL